MQKNLISKVWLIKGIFGKSTAGILAYRDGKVAFITSEGIQFHAPLIAMKEVRWPFLRMGLGFNVMVEQTKYKFSFSKPNPDAPDINIVNGNPLPKCVDITYAGNDLSSLATLKNDKHTTKQWKEILMQNKPGHK